VFATGRAWEQIRQSVCYPNLSVKVVASHAGITVGEDGGSHQSVEDIAVMRVIPNMTVIVPADGVETTLAIEAVAEHKGPMCAGRNKVATLFGLNISSLSAKRTYSTKARMWRSSPRAS
jgi:transketolase